MAHHHNNTHHTSSGAVVDGISQRVNNPRFSGPMTRRAHSFKCNDNHANTTSQLNALLNVHEIDIPLYFPKSENAVYDDGFDSVLEKNQTYLGRLIQCVHLKRKIESLNVDFGLGQGLEEKKQLGQWMFFVFVGVCLFLGILKFCANG